MSKTTEAFIKILTGILFVGIFSFTLKAMWLAAKFGWNLL